MDRFTFYTPEKLAQARLSYRQLTISGPEDGDMFFEAHGPGNTIEIADRPFERFEDYEALLQIMRNDDQVKYEKIHKGTPFYFLAWCAYDLKNYEKAVFYMDAAISEDMRNAPASWLNNPASQFLTLNHQGNQAAVRITKHLIKRISDELLLFNSRHSYSPAIEIQNFIEKFVKRLVIKKENHSIITAFYTFILEYEDREKELILRSTAGGSIEPVLTYLFKGGLIFESLLKYLYPKRDDGKDCKVLSDIYQTLAFKVDFAPITGTTAKSLQEIISSIGTDWQAAFRTTSQLRNTAGHNLVWHDVFEDPDNLNKLYKQQLTAILYLIQKKFL